MAQAKKCDICGSFYNLYNTRRDSENVNGFVLLNIDAEGSYFKHDSVDCCPTCMDSIKAYIKELSERSKIQKEE